jgi:hypothetical protein
MAGLGMDPAQDRVFWRQLLDGARWALLICFGVLGLVGAARAADAADYLRDLGLFVVVVLVLLWEVKRRYDGAPSWGFRDLVIDDPTALVVGLPLLGLLAVAGLLLASAADSESGYYAGLGLAVGAVGMAFLSLKARFDAEESRRD